MCDVTRVVRPAQRPRGGEGGAEPRNAHGARLPGRFEAMAVAMDVAPQDLTSEQRRVTAGCAHEAMAGDEVDALLRKKLGKLARAVAEHRAAAWRAALFVWAPTAEAAALAERAVCAEGATTPAAEDVLVLIAHADEEMLGLVMSNSSAASSGR